MGWLVPAIALCLVLGCGDDLGTKFRKFKAWNQRCNVAEIEIANLETPQAGNGQQLDEGAVAEIGSGADELFQLARGQRVLGVLKLLFLRGTFLRIRGHRVYFLLKIPKRVHSSTNLRTGEAECKQKGYTLTNVYPSRLSRTGFKS